MNTYIELVGLDVEENGRSCGIHTKCGNELKQGVYVKLVRTTIEIEEEVEVEVPIVELPVEPTVKKRGRPKKPKTEKVVEKMDMQRIFG